jgi:hypothetical protein
MDDKTKEKGVTTAMVNTPELNTQNDNTHPTPEKQKKNYVCFVYRLDVFEYPFCITGQKLRTLNALIDAGDKGITALSVSSWAFRLASYIYDLRHDHGLEIQTIDEPHEGGFHARYRLISNIKRA